MNPCDPVTDLSEAFLSVLRSGTYAPEESSSSSAGDTGSGSDGAAEGGGDADDDETGDEQVSDKKRLSDEAAKYRRLRNEERVLREAAEAKAKDAAERIKALEEGQASEALKVENQDLRLRMAFNDECHAFDVSDRDAIWKLAGDDIKVAVNEDGTVDPQRLRTVVGSLAERYPHFVKDDGPAEPAGAGLPPSGRRTDGKMRDTGNGTTSAVLLQKFPALRGH